MNHDQINYGYIDYIEINYGSTTYAKIIKVKTNDNKLTMVNLIMFNN
jgi:hypothetical protein